MSNFVRVVDEGLKTLLFTKFQTNLALTTQNTDIVFYPKAIAQRMIAEKRGANQAEFISFWRTGIQFDWQRQRSPIARRGIQLAYTSGLGVTSTVMAKAIPATISYDIYFWSRSLDKIMDVTETYLNWVHINPNLNVSFNSLYPMEIDMKFRGIQDDTAYIEDQFNKGALYISKATLDLEAWIITITDVKTILSIYMDVWYNDDLLTATTSDSLLLASQVITESDES